MESLEDIFHQSRESGRARPQTHRSYHPYELSPPWNGEGRKCLTVVIQLQLPDEVQGGEVLGFQTSQTLDSAGDIHKSMEVIPDDRVDHPHVDDEPKLLAVWFVDGEDG